MGFEGDEPFWGLKAMDDGDVTEIEQGRTEGWLLSCDDDSGSAVALFSNDADDLVGEVLGFAGLREEL